MERKKATAKELRSLLEEWGLAANHGLGQNFLLDTGIIEEILEAADPLPEENVLEIGPGPGILTEGLLERAGKVFAVELDKGMCGLLAERFKEQEGLTILHQDILKTDLEELCGANSGTWKAVANLPYYITTPVLFHLLAAGPLFSSITVMMQKEVAERLRAIPGTKSYGALSLAVQYGARVQEVTHVPPEAFWPRPKVESMVVRLIPYQEPPIQVSSPDNLFRVIRGAFGKRRKTLPNALERVKILPEGLLQSGKVPLKTETKEEVGWLLNKKTVEEAMKACGLDTKVRGEMLSLEAFAGLTNALTEMGK